MTSCEFCEGTFWLSNDRTLGPCVCATAEALLEALDEREQTANVIWSVLGEPDGGGGQDVAEAVRSLVDDQSAALENATDAFRAWLVRNGHPAHPVRLDDPHLDAMAEALF